MTEDEYEYFKMRSREKPGVMVIDFEKLINEGSEEQNIFLMDGDRIEVPKHKDYVSVLGMVARPGNVEYRAELSAKDYIRLAGGYADRAAKGKTRVIRVASGEWQKPGDVDQIHAGDTVWVPEKPDRDWWKFFRDGLLVATQIATLYLVADRAVN
jgi:protein involved in polysaccharide export with SLBB domain